jgi:NAD(P)-dependent dehydrogenase (short-subunit alcohol dehydrogenase family)
MTEPRRALVTGAASGLGLAVLHELVGRGAEVVGLDLPGDERRAAVEAAGAVFEPCDVTSIAEWERVVESVRHQFATVDLVVLNAGVMTRSPSDPIDDDPLDLAGSAGYRRVFAVNVDGVAFGLAAVRPLLRSGSSIVVTASTAGLRGNHFDPYYAASKHAVVGLVRSVAGSFAHTGVALNVLCPGGIDTPIVPDGLRTTLPTTAFRSPDDVALALLAVAEQRESGGTWLLSDDERLIWLYDAPALDARPPR